MIKIKIDKNRSNEPIFKLGFKELDEKENRFLKRALMDGNEIKGMYKYEIPLKYLLPFIKNLNKNNIKLDRYSKLAYLEFSDDFDENYYYILEANAKFMRKWREEGCPNIFKVEIDRETLDVKKEIIFKKIDRIYA